MKQKIINAYKNEINKSKGFPICIIVWKQNKILYKYTNLKAKSKLKTDYHNHAEYQFILNNANVFLKEISMLITVPPCISCYNELIKKCDIEYIYYLLDPWNKVINRKFLRTSKIPIEKFKGSYGKIIKCIKSAFSNKKHKTVRSAVQHKKRK